MTLTRINPWQYVVPYSLVTDRPAEGLELLQHYGVSVALEKLRQLPTVIEELLGVPATDTKQCHITVRPFGIVAKARNVPLTPESLQHDKDLAMLLVEGRIDAASAPTGYFVSRGLLLADTTVPIISHEGEVAEWDELFLGELDHVRVRFDTLGGVDGFYLTRYKAPAGFPTIRASGRTPNPLTNPQWGFHHGFVIEPGKLCLMRFTAIGEKDWESPNGGFGFERINVYKGPQVYRKTPH